MATATYKRTWTTLAIVGYTGGVADGYATANRSAHGGVCLLQVQQLANGVMARRVNSNGEHKEFGKPFEIDAGTLAKWHQIAKAAR
jgi:hypothetical protein